MSAGDGRDRWDRDAPVCTRAPRERQSAAAVIDDYLDRNRGTLRWMDHYERYARIWKAAFPGKTLREILRATSSGPSPNGEPRAA